MAKWICPNDARPGIDTGQEVDHKRFVGTSYVAETWIIDEEGDVLDSQDDEHTEWIEPREYKCTFCGAVAIKKEVGEDHDGNHR